MISASLLLARSAALVFAGIPAYRQQMTEHQLQRCKVFVWEVAECEHTP